MRPAREHVLLAAAGASLLASQVVAAREVGSTFFATELSILFSTILALAGPSLGYALSLRFRLSPFVVTLWAMSATVIQCSLPFGIRWMVASGGRTHPFGVGLVIALQLFVVLSYYSFLLPHVARPLSVPSLYAAELFGSLFALMGLFVVGSHSFLLLLCFVLPAPFVSFHLGVRWGALCAMCGVCLFCLYPVLSQAIAVSYYRRHHSVENALVVASQYSPYQRIDVVRSGEETLLFLDGVLFFQSGALHAFNTMLAKVPGRLVYKQNARALVVGSGSFSSAANLHRLGYSVRVVELDEQVAELGFRHFASVHRLQKGDVELHIGDARSVLDSDDETFDLVVLDVPAPYRIQTALLHSPAFYRQVLRRLKPEGIVSVSLCGRLGTVVANQIASSAKEVFPDFVVVESESVGMGFLYAGRGLPFSPSSLQSVLHTEEKEGAVIVSRRSVLRETLEVPSIGKQNFLGTLWLVFESL